MLTILLAIQSFPLGLMCFFLKCIRLFICLLLRGTDQSGPRTALDQLPPFATNILLLMFVCWRNHSLSHLISVSQGFITISCLMNPFLWTKENTDSFWKHFFLSWGVEETNIMAFAQPSILKWESHLCSLHLFHY